MTQKSIRTLKVLVFLVCLIPLTKRVLEIFGVAGLSLGANPELTLHSGDGSHAAMTGSYLAAAVFVGLLGDVEISSDANSWIAKGLDEIDGGLLREAAQEVLDAP